MKLKEMSPHTYLIFPFIIGGAVNKNSVLWHYSGLLPALVCSKHEYGLPNAAGHDSTTKCDEPIVQCDVRYVTSRTLPEPATLPA
jgi:hypothetical protein